MNQQRPLVYQPEAISFYIAASDQELLRQVRSFMQNSGIVGVADTAGRLHYVVDGSRGTPYAARRILDRANRCHEENDSRMHQIESQLPEAIDRVLDENGIRHELKGRAYLQYILYQAALDERKLKPLGKTLYPEVAKHFKARTSQIERDIRYAFSSAGKRGSWPSELSSGNTARITYLCVEVQHELRRLQGQQR